LRLQCSGFSKPRKKSLQKGIALQKAPVLPAAIAALLLATLVAGPFIQTNVATATEKSSSNSAVGNAPAIREGTSLFRANCSPCHGLNARGGGRGPDLTSGRWTHGSTDSAIFRTITQGVPGTEMPANGFDDSEIWAIIAYLRSLAPPKRAIVSGDPVNGEKIYSGTAGCSNCHMVNGSGGLLGPDLSRVGASRSVSYLIDSIRQPDKELSGGMLDPNNHYGLPLVYDTVTVVTADGRRITGVARNEDTFSIQLLATDQSLQFILKKDVKDVIHERKSLMPPYPEDTLSAVQLEDLLAYLETLRRD
jgi:cytochrome c oxidase cbb3-type subunit III